MDLAETQRAEKLTDSQDQYRVTREVPLPYSLDELDIDMDEDAEAATLLGILDRIRVGTKGVL